VEYYPSLAEAKSACAFVDKYYLKYGFDFNNPSLLYLILDGKV